MPMWCVVVDCSWSSRKERNKIWFYIYNLNIICNFIKINKLKWAESNKSNNSNLHAVLQIGTFTKTNTLYKYTTITSSVSGTICAVPE